MEKYPIKVAVACSNSDGSPAIPVFTVNVTANQYTLGEHYDLAQAAAETSGYEGPFVLFDDHEFGPLLAVADALRGAQPQTFGGND